MSKILGNARKCYVTTAAGTFTPAAANWLTGEVSNSINLNGNLVETSDKSSSWQTFLQGIKGATATVTLPGDTESKDYTAGTYKIEK